MHDDSRSSSRFSKLRTQTSSRACLAVVLARPFSIVQYCEDTDDSLTISRFSVPYSISIRSLQLRPPYRLATAVSALEEMQKSHHRLANRQNSVVNLIPYPRWDDLGCLAKGRAPSTSGSGSSVNHDPDGHRHQQPCDWRRDGIESFSINLS
jgi:hypothetical protein